MRGIRVYIHFRGISRLLRPPAQPLVANPRHQRPIDGYRIPLEPFRIVDWWDIRVNTAGRISELKNRQALGSRTRLPQKP